MKCAFSESHPNKLDSKVIKNIHKYIYIYIHTHIYMYIYVFVSEIRVQLQ